MSAVIEIRTYKLVPGTGAAFHPHLRRGIAADAAALGCGSRCLRPSLDDEDSYYLLRAYPSLEALQRSQDAFYGSDEWREGPREAIVSRIESGSSVVLPASAMLDYTR
jgi:hypothetical protein